MIHAIVADEDKIRALRSVAIAERYARRIIGADLCAVPEA